MKQVSLNLGITTILILSLLLIQAPTMAVQSDPINLELSYSKLQEGVFTGEYWFNQLGLGLDYSNERYQTSLLFAPVPDLKVKLGYDLTEESYLAEVDHNWKIGDNLAVDSQVKRFWPKDKAGDGVDYWDYQVQLDIGIGRRNSISPGISGIYSTSNQQDPEFFLHFDLNWFFKNNLHLQFEPHILIEGAFEHRMTLNKEFSNGVKAGLFTGQNRDKEWDIGVVLAY